MSLQVNNITHAQGLSNVYIYAYCNSAHDQHIHSVKHQGQFKLENPVIQVEALHVDFVAYMYTYNVHVHYVHV